MYQPDTRAIESLNQPSTPARKAVRSSPAWMARRVRGALAGWFGGRSATAAFTWSMVVTWPSPGARRSRMARLNVRGET